mmetsp:Transcript_77796/g.197651  ORF Transcript_77796/g.197651 Transcript_77796/m.197651 type:complete len:328 (-) Transcript_77796:49-1032(-)
MLGEHGVADARQVRGLRQVVAAASSPDEQVIRNMPDGVVGLLLRARERAAQGRDVLVVPSVAIGNRRPLGNARDLVPVVPPCDNPGVLGRVLVDPLVALQVVIHLDHSVDSIPHHRDDLRIRQGLRHGVAMLHEGRDLGLVAHDGVEHGRGEAEAGQEHEGVAVNEGAAVDVGFARAFRDRLPHAGLDQVLDLHDAAGSVLLVVLLEWRLRELTRVRRCLFGRSLLLGLAFAAVGGLLSLVLLALGILGLRLGLGLAFRRAVFDGGLVAVLDAALLAVDVLFAALVALLPQEQQDRLQGKIKDEAAPNRATDCADRCANQNQPRHLA